MATSNTIGNTSIDALTTIETAFMRCGVDPAEVSLNQLQLAKLDLYLILTTLSNSGVNLWCIKKKVEAVYLNQSYVTLPAGTLDILRANYRTLTVTAGTTIAASTYTGIQYATTQNVTTVGFTATTTGVANMVLEASPDGVTWTLVYTLDTALSVTAGQTYWYDIDLTTTNYYWRLRETVGASILTTNVTFGNAPTEIPMAALNRDDYTVLPNKESVGRPLQYWFDKQIDPNVRLWLWPVPNDPTAQLVTWLHQEIQDIGDLINQLYVPNRWQQAIIYQLGQKISYYPGLKIDPNLRGDLKQLAAEATLDAANGETDGAPIRIAPRIGAYTA